jgi:hypothetical protein
MKTITLSKVLAIACLAAACSSSSSSVGNTAGAQCTRIMDTACARLVNDCHESGTVADCVTAGVNACCSNQCSTTAVSAESSIDACVAALQTTSCADLTAANLPSVCHGVVKVMSLEPRLESQSMGAQFSSSDP